MALLLQRREGGMLLATPAEFWPDPQLVEAEEAGYPATIGPSIMDTMPLPTETDPEAFCEVLIIDLSLEALLHLRKWESVPAPDLLVTATFSGTPADNLSPAVEHLKRSRILWIDTQRRPGSRTT